MGQKTVGVLVEEYLQAEHDAGEIHVNDGDCDLVATHIVDAIAGLSDPEQIRRAVEVACFEDADAGMLGHPEIHPTIADIVLNSR
ncbi:hypothetical protein MOQ72_41420 [Saccharopolyspora sp. K220]|uniref:hypothetical protein n=1 Tax=Saccharopolyspora soli TaxID=2926618 RepID=UPI001F595EBB|nr:hypothetical protein [Saccharopolyspora soli]MCI2423881.1 hypothetical protein [Saccharopolyspora soli]